MIDPTKLKTLVLNADFVPLASFPNLVTIQARDAVSKVLSGSCIAVAEYDRKIGCPSIDMNWPAVIVRREYEHIEKSVHLNKTSLFFREAGSCMYCGCEFDSLEEVTVDHVVPRAMGGKTTWMNVVASCRDCNARKANSPPTGEWKPKYKPFEPSYYQLLDSRKTFPIEIWHESWKDFLYDWEGEIIIKDLRYFTTINQKKFA